MATQEGHIYSELGRIPNTPGRPLFTLKYNYDKDGRCHIRVDSPDNLPFWLEATIPPNHSTCSKCQQDTCCIIQCQDCEQLTCKLCGIMVAGKKIDVWKCDTCIKLVK